MRLRKAKAKKASPAKVLFAVAALALAAFQLAFLQQMYSQGLFSATLKTHRAFDHLSPNNLFATHEKDNNPSDHGESLEGKRKANGNNETETLRSKSNRVVVPATPTDAQRKLIQTAKDRGFHSVDDKGPILEILFQAGIQIESDLDQETLSLLPTWTQVQSLYGSQPKIYGLERCEEFRNAVEPTTRFFGMAGTFNTGTNLIADLMRFNCQITERMKVYGNESKGVRWQVPWGKHMLARYRDSEHTTRTDKDVPREHILPLVTIRDPYLWLQSMCRHTYAARWPHNKKHCPNLIATDADIKALPFLHNLYGRGGGDDKKRERLVPVMIAHAKDNIQNHSSLAHYYSEWYEEYFGVEYPRIMVRFEDLLFYGEQVTRAVCECGGGVPRLDNARSGSFTHVSKSAKLGNAAHGPLKDRTNLVGALIKYGSFANRTDSMTKEDLNAARHYFNPKIMEAFGYYHPAA